MKRRLFVLADRPSTVAAWAKQRGIRAGAAAHVDRNGSVFRGRTAPVVLALPGWQDYLSPAQEAHLINQITLLRPHWIDPTDETALAEWRAGS